jgi:hypothetical protein
VWWISQEPERVAEPSVFEGLTNQTEHFSMNKAFSLGLLAGGILLLIFGIIAYDSTSSDISRFFTGSATDKSIWLLAGGVAATIAGLFGLSRGAKAI